jgi:hypothetical protein
MLRELAGRIEAESPKWDNPAQWAEVLTGCREAIMNMTSAGAEAWSGNMPVNVGEETR